tara:strand:- start:330 stop:440 length:111 start_codon:yes stop_codon:yes gene_type:complete
MALIECQITSLKVLKKSEEGGYPMKVIGLLEAFRGP